MRKPKLASQNGGPVLVLGVRHPPHNHRGMDATILNADNLRALFKAQGLDVEHPLLAQGYAVLKEAEERQAEDDES